MKLFANLHNHSTHSDGVFTPEQLVLTAKGEGYSAIALTDHDTVTGNREVAEVCARPDVNMECLFGAEFTSPAPELHAFMHLTAYGFDPDYPEMREYLAGMSLRETDQTRILFERGIENGFLHDITWDEVLEYNEGITWICNEQVFRTLKHKGLATDLDYPAFFANVYGEYRGKVPPCYDFLPADRMIDLVHRAGGIIFAAHPHRQLRVIPGLREYGIDGLEVWHQMLTPEERREALQIAADLDLYVSGGEDHEGLCGGQYSRYADPTTLPFYAEPLSLGTTEKFFREIQSRKKDPDRKAYIASLLEE